MVLDILRANNIFLDFIENFAINFNILRIQIFDYIQSVLVYS